MKPYSHLFHPFDWRGFHLYGGGMLGDWGAHIIDFIHHHLALGLPTKATPIQLRDYNQISFPLSSDIEMKSPSRREKGQPSTCAGKRGKLLSDHNPTA